ncbi:BBSome-interacting protein 1 [Episyrphus balteatus]|uniref:BBSome-interacting protein 1 n=1 Tax=Episyrphus balteatus TaxID=286459 RepID=UPI0024852692|nr:BBSome-interacting protein 1 [Episyrphus balteatus]
MSSEENQLSEKIDLIEPTTGKLFFETKSDLVFCKPHLMPLKSLTLERLENMQKKAQQQLQENRLKTAVVGETDK